MYLYVPVEHFIVAQIHRGCPPCLTYVAALVGSSIGCSAHGSGGSWRQNDDITSGFAGGRSGSRSAHAYSFIGPCWGPSFVVFIYAGLWISMSSAPNQIKRHPKLTYDVYSADIFFCCSMTVKTGVV